VGEAAAVSRTIRTDIRRTTARRRAVGTRDRIIAHLEVVAEIADGTGMASTRLAEAVGYPGSSVAFAQLLSGMERDGLIRREVRGKRTYRIRLSEPHPARRGRAAVNSAPGGLGAEEEGHSARPDPFLGPADYDDLADRVIIRLLRRISELNATELSALERLLVPGQARAEELKIV
jgi:hypothetical protein